MKTRNKLEAIADEIIGYSSGSFNIGYSEAYEELTPEEQTKVDGIVNEAVGNCDECGWYWMYEDMERHSDGGCYCWQCYKDVLDREEEDE
jgi:formylmethanofuran dehydrogenase subunit E